jgi:hypothetical protein
MYLFRNDYSSNSFSIFLPQHPILFDGANPNQTLMSVIPDILAISHPSALAPTP